MYLFRIPICTLGKIIPEVCGAIYQVVKRQIFKGFNFFYLI